MSQTYSVDLLYTPDRADEIILLLEAAYPRRVQRYGAVVALLWYCWHGAAAFWNRLIELTDWLLNWLTETLKRLITLFGTVKSLILMILGAAAYIASHHDFLHEILTTLKTLR